MEIVTKKDLCKDVAKRWRELYPNNNDDEYGNIYKKLKALNGSGTEEEIRKIIGNSSWTQHECYECDKDVDVLIHLGEPQDYESTTFYICEKCFKKALKLLTK